LNARQGSHSYGAHSVPHHVRGARQVEGLRSTHRQQSTRSGHGPPPPQSVEDTFCEGKLSVIRKRPVRLQHPRNPGPLESAARCHREAVAVPVKMGQVELRSAFRQEATQARRPGHEPASHQPGAIEATDLHTAVALHGCILRTQPSGDDSDVVPASCERTTQLCGSPRHTTVAPRRLIERADVEHLHAMTSSDPSPQGSLGM
jgi:hypothetical protein